MKTPLLLTGATGLMGQLLVEALGRERPEQPIVCITRTEERHQQLQALHPQLTFLKGDTAIASSWDAAFAQHPPETIIHLVQLRQVPTLLASLQRAQLTPRLIIIGTTGVYSRYNQYSQEYREAEAVLQQYAGSYCLFRPTMIYGSPRDKNLHKLIRFCDRYGRFPVFGSGQCLLQPVHAGDLAQALLTAYLNPEIQGAYDLSGGSIVSFLELLALVEKLLGKPVQPLKIPYNLGVWSATLLESVLGRRSPVRREQILRLQEDKAYSHAAATAAFGYQPRSLEVGLAQEVELLRATRLIQASGKT
ncbi:NAD-dependent epimerase/dehydratase family protein [Leptolyngbya iicbica]|uniref:NAD-dependent epimerase/dehydratase family protein n=2 Tax=Cyanophyceae TaxID=3028117 RepID=A0A4Q7EFK0_9CYAN|nr:NAD-dependent epimerase/dehydratase family protein [Leptolyngbya sp. LK]RZM82351.1 NAD-dependent epimerase/dehydratase family protein [Leptolyngbya sp. LK]